MPRRRAVPLGANSISNARRHPSSRRRRPANAGPRNVDAEAVRRAVPLRAGGTPVPSRPSCRLPGQFKSVTSSTIAASCSRCVCARELAAAAIPEAHDRARQEHRARLRNMRPLAPEQSRLLQPPDPRVRPLPRHTESHRDLLAGHKPKPPHPDQHLDIRPSRPSPTRTARPTQGPSRTPIPNRSPQPPNEPVQPIHHQRPFGCRSSLRLAPPAEVGLTTRSHTPTCCRWERVVARRRHQSAMATETERQPPQHLLTVLRNGHVHYAACRLLRCRHQEPIGKRCGSVRRSTPNASRSWLDVRRSRHTKRLMP
jgi:hypothetical protein